jgi:hypothetical protein
MVMPGARCQTRKTKSRPSVFPAQTPHDFQVETATVGSVTFLLQKRNYLTFDFVVTVMDFKFEIL